MFKKNRMPKRYKHACLLALMLSASISAETLILTYDSTVPSVVYADENDDSSQNEEEAGRQLQAYKEAQYLQLEAKINAAKTSNHLSDSVIRQLDQILGDARVTIFENDSQAIVDGAVASATTLMEGLITGSQTSTHNFLALTDTYRTPTAYAGQNIQITLPVVSYADSELSDVVVRAVVDSSVNKWPFIPNSAGSVQTIKSFPPYKNTQNVNNIDMSGVRQDISFYFTVRDDVKTGYYPLTFHFVYTRNGKEEEGDLTTFIRTVGKEENGKLDDQPDASKGRQQPRLIVTGFSTVPERIQAGDTFTVTIFMQNTSSKDKVTNVLFDMQAATETTGTGSNSSTYQAFLPTSGSSSVFVESIAPGATHELSIEMTARADLTEKPYVLNVTMKYDYGEQFNLEDTASVSIPIHQQPRCETGAAEVIPASISTGGQSNVTFGVYNTGKTVLNNVWVRFRADSVSGGDTFLGNISPGGTGNLDAMITGVAPTMDDGRVIAEISFENDQGEITTVEKEISLFVTEETMESDFGGYDMGDFDEVPQTDKGLPGGILVWMIAGILLVIVIIVIVLRARKKKKELAADMKAIEDDEDDLLAGTGFNGKDRK